MFRRLVPTLLWLATAAAFTYGVWYEGPADPSADTGYLITDYDVTATLADDGSVKVTERVAVNFSMMSRGLRRDIPTHYVDVEGGFWGRRVPIGDVEVRTETSAPDDLLVTDRWDRVDLRVGDPDTFILGDHVYVFTYVMEAVVLPADTIEDGTGRHELVLDAIGYGWGATIQAASVEVIADGVDEVSCAAGPIGVDTPCAEAELTSTGGRFTADALGQRRGMTVALAIDPDALEPPPVLREPANRFLAHTAAATPDWPVTLIWLLGGLVVGLVIVRRASPLDSHPAVPAVSPGARWRPPDDASPAEVAALMSDDPSTGRMVAGGVLDLVSRGVLQIDRSSGIPQVRWTEGRARNLSSADRAVLEAVFGVNGRTPRVVKLTELNGDGMVGLRGAVLGSLGTRGWHDRERSKAIAQRAMTTAFLLWFGGAIATVTITWAFSEVWFPPLPFAAGLVVAGGHGRIRARRARPLTAAGEQARAQAEALADYIDVAERSRLEFAVDENEVITLMGHAVALGLEHEVVDLMAARGVAVPASVAAVAGHDGMATLAVSVQSGERHAAQEVRAAAAASRASSSGDSSFSDSGSSGGGGVSTGGGSGGGGGGRW